MIPYEVRYWLYSLYNRHKELILKIAIISIALMCATVSCSYLNKKVGMDDDNVIEQSIEFVIEQQTGLDIDLTP